MMKAILGNAEVNDEKLTTTIIGVKLSFLNSRPLTHLRDDANDEQVLTQNHFLVRQMTGGLAPESVDCYTSFNTGA